MQKRIFLKYFITSASIILLTLAAMGGLCASVLAQQRIEETTENLESAAGKLATMYARMPKNSYLVAGHIMGTAMDVVKEALSADVIIINDGSTVAMSTVEGMSENSRNTLVPDEAARQVLNGQDYRATGQFLQRDGARTAYTVGKPVMTGDNEIIGAVFVTTTSVGMWRYLAPFLLMYMAFTGLALMIALVIVYFVSARMFRPLTQMGEAVKAYADGDFSMRLDVRGSDELGELASAFNNMADSLDRLETMRRGFVEDVSHELRTPMTTIGGFIDGILDGVIEPKDQNKYLTIVSAEIRRLSRMVSSMLDVARIDSGEMVYNKTAFDMAEVLQKNLTGFEERLREKNINVLWKGDESGDYYVYADQDSVYRVVFNLLDNALKFVNDGGTVTLTLAEKDGAVLTGIRNTGKGIDPKDAGHIFERFYKTDKSRSENKRGVGIGLYLVRTIIKDLGGDIYVSSGKDEFAEFSFTLPKPEV